MKIALYQLLALVDNAVIEKTYVTLFYNGHVMFAGYADKCPDKYAKYPVVQFRVLPDQHLMITIV